MQFANVAVLILPYITIYFVDLLHYPCCISNIFMLHYLLIMWQHAFHVALSLISHCCKRHLFMLQLSSQFFCLFLYFHYPISLFTSVFINFFQLPPEYQKIAVKYNNLMLHDVVELADVVAVTMKEKIKAMWTNRNTQMLAEMSALNKQNKDTGIKVPTCEQGTSDQPVDKVVDVCDHPEQSNHNEQTGKDVLLPSTGIIKNASISAAESSDIPSFDLFKPDDPEYADICGGQYEKIDAKGTFKPHPISTTPQAIDPGDSILPYFQFLDLLLFAIVNYICILLPLVNNVVFLLFFGRGWYCK